MADLGYIALLVALVASIYTTVAFILGTKGRNPALIDSAKNSLLAVCGLVSLAVAALLFALVTHDFQIEYVANYTSRDMSLTYLLSALWAGNDGSLLFWGWLLSVFATVLVFQKREVGNELVAYATPIIMATETFFLALLLFVANPFLKLPFVPAEGRGLNPLLENPGMLFHPPFLLAGYVGFTIPFAFAMAALLTRRLGDEWIIAMRRWTLITWIFLGLGNLFGAWWAYVELGWGGYWAWDPVENASFLPWLVATAFLHSMMMQRRRGILKIWNMVLITLTFSLSILGTFLTRSGVLSSVHTFAESPLLGALFLAFIGLALFFSLGLLYIRSEELKGEAEMESLVSRESTFLLNNLLLVGAAFAIFLGTFFPVISEAVRGVKITVGPPFFNQVNAPIFLAIILLAGICTLIGWRRASVRNLQHNFRWPLILSLVTGITLFFFAPPRIEGIREMAVALIIVSLAFVWLGYETDRLTIRLSVGQSSNPIPLPNTGALVLLQNFLWPLVIALALAIAFFFFFFGTREWFIIIVFMVCSFVISTILYEWFRGTRARHHMSGENYLKAFGGLIGANRPRYGGYIVHIGIILLAIGIIGSSLYNVEKEVLLKPDETMTIKNYTLTYKNMDSYQTESKEVFTATIAVSNAGKSIGELTPEKYFHRSYEQAVSEVAIRYTFLEDLYIILVGWDEDGTTAFKVLVNPLVSWIWIGGGIVVFGGLLAFWPERRRLATTRQEKGEGE